MALCRDSAVSAGVLHDLCGGHYCTDVGCCEARATCPLIGFVCLTLCRLRVQGLGVGICSVHVMSKLSPPSISLLSLSPSSPPSLSSPLTFSFLSFPSLFPPHSLLSLPSSLPSLTFFLSLSSPPPSLSSPLSLSLGDAHNTRHTKEPLRQGRTLVICNSN